MKGLTLIGALTLMLIMAGCSSQEPVAVEYYQPAYRSTAPEPVYNRVIWSHLPGPVRPRSDNKSPYILPIVSFEFPDATFEEAIEALAQTMGYRWHYPKSIAKRPIHIRMEGSVEEVLAEISKQARVKAMFDHQQKLVRVVEKGTEPKLPGRW